GHQPGSELLRPAVRRVPDPGHSERRFGETAHRDDEPPPGEQLEERPRRFDLGCPWTAVRPGLAGQVRMRRNDVPEEHVLVESELLEHAVDDRRRRLGRAAPRQLALRRERNPAHPRAAVAGRLAHEQQLGFRAPLEVVGEPLTQQRGTCVLVERRTDLRCREALDQNACARTEGVKRITSCATVTPSKTISVKPKPSAISHKEISARTSRTAAKPHATPDPRHNPQMIAPYTTSENTVS